MFRREEQRANATLPRPIAETKVGSLEVLPKKQAVSLLRVGLHDFAPKSGLLTGDREQLINRDRPTSGRTLCCLRARRHKKTPGLSPGGNAAIQVFFFGLCYADVFFATFERSKSEASKANEHHRPSARVGTPLGGLWGANSKASISPPTLRVPRALVTTENGSENPPSGNAGPTGMAEAKPEEPSPVPVIPGTGLLISGWLKMWLV